MYSIYIYTKIKNVSTNNYYYLYNRLDEISDSLDIISFNRYSFICDRYNNSLLTQNLHWIICGNITLDISLQNSSLAVKDV